MVTRYPWENFPETIAHVGSATLKSHPAYEDAKLGDVNAARRLVADYLQSQVFRIKPDFICPVLHADQNGKFDAIPIAFAESLSHMTGAKTVLGVIQSNAIRHDAMTGIPRLLFQPEFDGKAPKGSYCIVDALTTFGSTLANLRSHLIGQGSTVIASSTLAFSIGTSKLQPEDHILNLLRSKHGSKLSLIEETLGFKPNCLTGPEAHFTLGIKNLESLRDPTIPSRYSIGYSI